MPRHKKFEKKGSQSVIASDDEALEEADKQKKIKKTKKKSWLEIDRKLFITNILQISAIIDCQITKKTEQSKFYNLSRSKNILQSLVYLILNPIFYNEVVEIRKKIGIQKYGFKKTNSYKKWAIKYFKEHDINYQKRKLDCAISKKAGIKNYEDVLCSFGYNKVFQEAESFVKKYKLTHKKDISSLTLVVASFLARRLKFKSFMNKIVPVIYEDGNKFFVGGFDVKIKEFPVSFSEFYKYEWEVRLYAFIKRTDLENKLKDFFQTELMHQKNKKSYDKDWIDFQMKKIGFKKEQKSNSELQIIDDGDSIILKYTTDFFTKPSQIINLYKKRKLEINVLIKQKEKRFKEIQKKKLSRNFRRNYMIYDSCIMNRKKSLQTIYESIFGESEDITKEDEERKSNVIKGEIGEFNANIRDAIKRKIDF